MNTRLLSHLTEERGAIEAFLELLDQEVEMLAQGNFAALPALTKRKEQLADQIALLDLEREQQQVALGYPADHDGAHAAALAGGENLQQAWQALLESAEQARERNHRNGVMIHTHLDYTRQSINFLRACGQSLYGPDGQHKTGLGNGNSIAAG